MTNCANAAATIHAHLCNHEWHGYTQGNGRWGDGEGVCTVNVEGRTYTVAQGDRDCSSSDIDAWVQALKGTAYEGKLDAATYTGNMRAVFVGSCLFDWHPMGDGYIAKRGDIYLNESDHTAMCQSATPDMLSEFVINEHGGIVGGQVGDQTGDESHIRPYYDYPWDGILAYNGKADSASQGGAWVKDAKGWWYRYADGSWPANKWVKLDAWYWFGADGYATTGWQSVGGKWYHMDANCRMQTGWLSDAGKWYYLDGSGAMVTGWCEVGGTWYYLDASGVMQTGWVKVGGKWYWLAASGAMAKSSVLNIGGKWYAFGPSGNMVECHIDANPSGALDLDDAH